MGLGLKVGPGLGLGFGLGLGLALGFGLGLGLGLGLGIGLTCERRMSRRMVQRSCRILHSSDLHSMMTTVFTLMVTRAA